MTGVCYNSLFCMYVKRKKEMKEGRKEEFYLMMHSTHFIYSHNNGVRNIVKDHSDSKKVNLLPPHGLLFPISSKGSFICIIPQTG